MKKTPDQKRAEAEAKKQQRTLDEARDVFVTDKRGEPKPANPSGSIFEA